MRNNPLRYLDPMGWSAREKQNCWSPLTDPFKDIFPLDYTSDFPQLNNPAENWQRGNASELSSKEKLTLAANLSLMLADTVGDVISTGYDTYQLIKNPTDQNKLAVGIDMGSLAIPLVSATVVKAGARVFSKADDLVETVKAVNKTENLLPDDILKLSEANIGDSGKTILGRYPGYIEKAKRMDGSYFDIGKTWDSLSDAQRTTANKHFLDVIAEKGDQVYLSTPKGEIIRNSSLDKEIEYLTSEKGYNWINQWSLKKR